MFFRHAARMLAILALVELSLGDHVHAAIDVWDNTPGGNWSNGANWTDGSVPSTGDSATFNLAQTYPVAFSADPGVIQALAVSAGSVTFHSGGGAQTLPLLAATGSQDFVVSGATTTLTLGTANNPLHITAGDDLSIQSGATVVARFGSKLAANDLGDAGLNGTLRVDGAGSQLTLGGNVPSTIGGTGTGSLLLQSGSTGNSINANLGIASTVTVNTNGTLSVLSGSTLVLGGNLTMASQNITGQTATLSIQGTNSVLTQNGGSSATIGSATNGTAAITIGTTASGAAFTTGAGLFTINKTGSLTIGGGSNLGTLNLGGDVKIDGGVLNKASAASTLDFAAGKTITIQGGGRLTIAGAAAAEANQIFNITGAGSKIESSGTGGLAIGSGAAVNISAAATLHIAGRIHVANGAGTGALTAAGEGSTLTAATELSRWGHDGGVANVSLSNKAVATLSAGIDLANSATAGTTAAVSVLSGAVLNTGVLNLAAVGGTTTAATLHVNGANSAVTQAGAATLTVGHQSEGSAVINVGTANDGGALTTGSGLFRINKTGRVTIGSGENIGALNVLGNILVDGGVLEQGSEESKFSWTTGKTLTIENGGRVHFASPYTAAPSAIHAVTGAGSKFEIAGALQIRSASQVNVAAGAKIDAEEFSVGGGGASGTLTVDGAGSIATGRGGVNHWGSGGNATVTFSNQAMGSLSGTLALAESAPTTVHVLSGADLAAGDLSIAAAGGGVTGTLNVVGVGSTVNLAAASDVVVGHATSGTAAVNVDDGGAFSVGIGSTTTVNGTGTVNIAAGTADLAALTVVGGMINVNGGKLVFSSLTINGGAVKFNGGRVEQAGNLAAEEALLTSLLGPTHELNLGRTLAASSGTATVSANLDLNGGRLEGNALSVVNSGLNATVLRLRNGGTAQSTGAISLSAGTSVFVENGSAMLAGGQLTQSSELRLSGNGRVAANSLLNTGLVTGSGRIDANLANQSAGQIRLGDEERLVLRGTSHQNNGLIDVDHAEFEVATGAFVNGTANPSTATISVREGALRFTAGLTNAGSIVCSEGTCDFFGNLTNVINQPATGRIVITANSQATFFGNVVNQGTIQVSAAGQVASTALFLGSLSGNGVTGSGSVFLEGDVRPGTGIGAMSLGTMSFGGDASIGSAAVVRMELGGGSASQHDRIAVAGAMAFGGTLEVALAGGFTPAAGQSFDLFDWGTRSGTFAALNLPALAGLTWNTSQLTTTGILSVATANALPGDFNRDGNVDAADYTVWRNGLGPIYNQSHYTEWKTHFGQSTGGAATNFVRTIPTPEPCSLLLVVFAMVAAALARARISRLPNVVAWVGVLAVMIAPTLARAAITALGDVSPNPATTNSSSALRIGNTATGTVIVSAGSDVLALNSTLGDAAGAVGVARIEGAGSTWTMGQALLVGNSGSGIVQVTTGGQIQSGSGIIAALSDSTGTVSIDGAGSKWMVGTTLAVGGAGGGTLALIDGGMVDVGGNVYLGNSSSGDGTIRVVDGVLRLHGASLAVNAGTGTLDFSGGRVEGVGIVDLNAPLVQSGGAFAPGNGVGSTLVQGGYVLDAGRLEIELDGPGTPGVNWDRMQVNGAVNLVGEDGLANGELNVLLDFAPAIASEFVILQNDSSDAIQGAFASGSVVSADFVNRRYQFEIRYNAGDGNDLALRTQAIQLLGDFNGNGKVDAADYTVWRDGLGSVYTNDDYADWKANFGQTLGGSGADSQAIPEPAASAFVVVLVLAGAASPLRAGRTS